MKKRIKTIHEMIIGGDECFLDRSNDVHFIRHARRNANPIYEVVSFNTTKDITHSLQQARRLCEDTMCGRIFEIRPNGTKMLVN